MVDELVNANTGKWKINILMAHHNCHMLKDTHLPVRPVMTLIGKDHVNQRNYYKCPACNMEIMLQATVKEG